MLFKLKKEKAIQKYVNARRKCIRGQQVCKHISLKKCLRLIFDVYMMKKRQNSALKKVTMLVVMLKGTLRRKVVLYYGKGSFDDRNQNRIKMELTA